PIALALQLREHIAPEQIEAVTIDTYWFTWSVIGSGPEKWRPATRETADHSLPYIMAAVLVDGRFSEAMFSAERLCDPRTLAMADRIAINENQELTKQYPQRLPCRLEITLKNGERKVATCEYPRGHHKNPMSDAELTGKFRGLAGAVL